MAYPIVVYGSPVLRQIAKEISADYPNLKELIYDMFETMYQSDGMGLAAPQIGKSIRIFVVDTTMLESEEDPTLKDFKQVFINPGLTILGDETEVMNEGCLSLPKIYEDVDRYNKIRITYHDENWNFHEEIYEGLKARIIQHEYDHIDGVLFIDKIAPLRRKLLKGRLNDISKCKVDTKYKIKVIR